MFLTAVLRRSVDDEVLVARTDQNSAKGVGRRRARLVAARLGCLGHSELLCATDWLPRRAGRLSGAVWRTRKAGGRSRSGLCALHQADGLG